MTIYLDVSQLVLDPRRSGIQRAQRELIRHWPGPRWLVPCRFDPVAGEMRALPESILAALCADAAPGGIEEDRRRLQPHLERPGPLLERDGLTLLCIELFPGHERAAYYQGLGAGTSAFWLIYDFLPWLHPEWFGPGTALSVMPYLRALMSVRNLAFISPATRRDCAERVLRTPCEGPVIPMGGDGLGLERQRFEASRRDFVMLGTIEPRKKAAPAMRAFRLLREVGVDASLTLIGGIGADASEEEALLRELSGEPWFRHLQGSSDEVVRAMLAGARAVLFPSEGEGYGIPPMEALHAGVPVIVSATLPALEGLPALGQLRLAEINEQSIAAAVRTLLDDEAAARLWGEAARMEVPTWRSFARALADWVHTEPKQAQPEPAWAHSERSTRAAFQ